MTPGPGRRAVVLGATGTIGSAVVWHLDAAEWSVVGVARSGPASGLVEADLARPLEAAVVARLAGADLVVDATRAVADADRLAATVVQLRGANTRTVHVGSIAELRTRADDYVASVRRARAAGESLGAWDVTVLLPVVSADGGLPALPTRAMRVAAWLFSDVDVPVLSAAQAAAAVVASAVGPVGDPRAGAPSLVVPGAPRVALGAASRGHAPRLVGRAAAAVLGRCPHVLVPSSWRRVASWAEQAAGRPTHYDMVPRVVLADSSRGP